MVGDEVRRAERLARDLGPGQRWHVQDLYDETVPATALDLIVSDVALVTSEAILRLKRILGQVRGAGVPFLFLTHGNAARRGPGRDRHTRRLEPLSASFGMRWIAYRAWFAPSPPRPPPRWRARRGFS